MRMVASKQLYKFIVAKLGDLTNVDECSSIRHLYALYGWKLEEEAQPNDNCENFRLFIINHYSYAIKINIVIKELNNNFFLRCVGF